MPGAPGPRILCPSGARPKRLAPEGARG